MKKLKLNLLVSSMSVVLIFVSSQKARGMENDNLEPRLPRAASQNLRILSFLQNNSLYHQVATEEYRSSTKTLNQEIENLEQQIKSFRNNSEAEVLEKKEIEPLEEKKRLLQKALEQYESPEKAKEAINKEIAGLEEEKKSYEGKIVSDPRLKNMYEDTIKKVEEDLKVARNRLEPLNSSVQAINRQLATIRKIIHKNTEANSVERLKQSRSKKIENLKTLYKEHVKGLCDSDIFSQELPKAILKGLGISSDQLNHVKEEKLFHLFARTLELPYVYLKTGEDKETAYLDKLKSIDQNLTCRLREDVCAFRENENVAKKQVISIDFDTQSKKAERYFMPNAITKTINRTQDINNLTNILSSYGYVMEEYGWPLTTPGLINIIMNKFPYGLLGLCVASLESYPTSWSPAGQVAAYVSARNNAAEISNNVVENILLILGRHINKHVLQTIEKKLREKPDPKENSDEDVWVG